MSRAPKPQDRRPKSAPQREAEAAETVELEHGDHVYTVPADQDDWPLEALEAFEQQQIIAGVRALLGAEQWEQFKANGTTRRDFREFFEAIAVEFGFSTAGN